MAPTILVVEDTAEIKELVTRTLQLRPQCDVVTAGSGAETRQLLKRQKPNLIFLDMHLPDISGDKLLDEIRADTALHETPVVVMTADAPSQEERVRLSGATDYVNKPFRLTDLLKVVDKYV